MSCLWVSDSLSFACFSSSMHPLLHCILSSIASSSPLHSLSVPFSSLLPSPLDFKIRIVIPTLNLPATRQLGRSCGGGPACALFIDSLRSSERISSGGNGQKQSAFFLFAFLIKKPELRRYQFPSQASDSRIRFKMFDWENFIHFTFEEYRRP